MKPLTCLLKKEGSQYASLCVELDIASCGKNKKEALEGLRDAAEAYLEYIVVVVPRNKRSIPQGTLSSIWRQAGINRNIAEQIWNRR